MCCAGGRAVWCSFVNTFPKCIRDVMNLAIGVASAAHSVNLDDEVAVWRTHLVVPLGLCTQTIPWIQSCRCTCPTTFIGPETRQVSALMQTPVMRCHYLFKVACFAVKTWFAIAVGPQSLCDPCYRGSKRRSVPFFTPRYASDSWR